MVGSALVRCILNDGCPLGGLRAGVFRTSAGTYIQHADDRDTEHEGQHDLRRHHRAGTATGCGPPMRGPPSEYFFKRFFILSIIK